VGLATYLFVIPFVRRGVWFGWNGLGLQHLPFMILPDAMVTKMFPGIEKQADWWDDRHLKGIEVPETESWAWTEKDMKLIRSMSVHGKSPVEVTVDKISKSPDATVETELALNKEDPTPSSAIEAAAPAAESATETTTMTNPTVPALNNNLAETGTKFQPILAYKSLWNERVNNYKAAMAAPGATLLTKAKLTGEFILFYGVDRDVADYGLNDETVANIHDVAIKNYGKTESVFRFLQFLTSCLACLAHGANDVGLSVGPIAILYGYWSDSKRWQGKAISSTPVLDWQIAIGAVSLVLGLWFYGYNMMRVLGNRLTYHSPSRGFSMEMGAAITVLIAARNGIPVSTTNCIVGATVGVGIASGGFKSINWKLTAFTFFSWILTVPFCAVMSGALYAFGSFTPSMGCAKYTMTMTNSTGGALTSAQRANLLANYTKISIATTLPGGGDTFTKPGSFSSANSFVFYSPGCAYINA
jgi:phosphate/sulfate permease